MLEFKEVEDFDLREWRRTFLSCMNGKKVTFKQEQLKRYAAVNFRSMKKTQNSEKIFQTCEQFAKLIMSNVGDKGVKVAFFSNMPKEGGEAVICFFDEE